MSTKTEIVVGRASSRKVFSAIFQRDFFNSHSPLHSPTLSRGVLSEMSFHEKDGRSQGNSLFEASSSFFSFAKIPLLPSSSRHASIRTLEERIISLGACWAFSIQPVLPSDWRPIVSLKSGTWPRPLTQSPELGFGFLSFLFRERF
jgi:hypothetical protein